MPNPATTDAPILLLDLRVSARGFFAAENLHDAGESLAAAGLDVRFVRSVAELRGDDWDTRLAELVTGIAPRAVIVQRVWQSSTIAAIKNAGIAAFSQTFEVLRLDDGHPSALDKEFDAVVDEERLLDWARGGSGGSVSTHYAPTTRELRKRRDEWKAPPRRMQFTVLEDPDEVISVGRPVLKGPAEGCPFLLDSRSNPVFADLPLDQTQHRGCSFCLDNIGAFAMPKTADVVAAWIDGMLKARRSNPTVKEVLLADERPHPMLPALFAEMAKHPSLRGIEVLIKSRVDWLLQYEETALTEALTIADAADVVLHAYLVGFESFDAFHLQLFNKGVTVADNVAAIGALERLEAQFPERFEFRRYRAHGVVLFTPWTRPDHLVAASNVMAEVGFSALRAASWRTRLRIYAGLPLHALALRDGLTETAFPAHRPDRAAEQGYNASVPWTFADARTELCFSVLQHVAWRWEGRLDEADVIGVVARFSIAFGQLAESAEGIAAAHLVLMAGVASLPPDELQAAVAARDLGLLAEDAALKSLLYAAGTDAASADASGTEEAAVKNAVVRRCPIPGAVRELAQAYRSLGLAAAVLHADAVVIAKDGPSLEAAQHSVDVVNAAAQHEAEGAQRAAAVRIDDEVAAALAEGPLFVPLDAGLVGFESPPVAKLVRWAPVMRGVALHLELAGARLEFWALPQADNSAAFSVAHRQVPQTWPSNLVRPAVVALQRWIDELVQDAVNRADSEDEAADHGALPAAEPAALRTIADRVGLSSVEQQEIHAHWLWAGGSVDLHHGHLLLLLRHQSGREVEVFARRRGAQSNALCSSKLLDLSHGAVPPGVEGVEVHAALEALALELRRRESAGNPNDPQDTSRAVDGGAGGDRLKANRLKANDLDRGSLKAKGPSVERLSFEAGIKPLLRVERVAHDRWVERFGADMAKGWVAAPSLNRYDAVDNVRTRNAQGEFVDVFVGLNAADVDAAVLADEREKEGNAPDATRTLGRLLGYPDCCVAAFLTDSTPGDNDAWPEKVAARSGTGPWPWLLNPLPVGETLTPFMPCSFDCTHAAAYADAAFTALLRHDRARAGVSRAAQTGHFLYWGGGRFRRVDEPAALQSGAVGAGEEDRNGSATWFDFTGTPPDTGA